MRLVWAFLTTGLKPHPHQYPQVFLACMNRLPASLCLLGLCCSGPQLAPVACALHDAGPGPCDPNPRPAPAGPSPLHPLAQMWTLAAARAFFQPPRRFLGLPLGLFRPPRGLQPPWVATLHSTCALPRSKNRTQLRLGFSPSPWPADHLRVDLAFVSCFPCSCRFRVIPDILTGRVV